jgi:fumarylacetoacetase
MALTCWVPLANEASDFPIENLPYGVYDAGSGPRLGVANAPMLLDVARVPHELDPKLLARTTWNTFIATGPAIWASLRRRPQDLLSDEAHGGAIKPHLIPQADAQMKMPFRVSEYTDFYGSGHHVQNVGRMFRDPANALPPNWLSIAVGYNGRASSVVVLGTDVTRPWGQIKTPQAHLPHFANSSRFDFELELGAIVGQPSTDMLSVQQADDMIFGYVLLNDWSARDIQAWEYQPLGPFQSKVTATPPARGSYPRRRWSRSAPWRHRVNARCWPTCANRGRCYMTSTWTSPWPRTGKPKRSSPVPIRRNCPIRRRSSSRIMRRRVAR